MNNLTESTLICVEFFKPMQGSRVWYFGSLAAVYSMFSEEEIGCKVETLYCAGLDHGERKITRHCVIYKEKMYRKAHKTKKIALTL